MILLRQNVWLKEITGFFFSSRGRHTLYIGDWSSDVCSSDLRQEQPAERRPPEDPDALDRAGGDVRGGQLLRRSRQRWDQSGLGGAEGGCRDADEAGDPVDEDRKSVV